MRNPWKILARVILVLLPVLLLFGAGYGCGSTVDTTPKVFMWKITSGSTYVYLLGTVQVNDKLIYPMNSAIENAYNATDDLVVEVNINHIDQDEINQYITDHGMYTGEDGFQANVPAELYSQLENFALTYQIALKEYDLFKPWVINTVISNTILYSLGYSSDLGMEKYFISKAETAGKNIVEMTSINSQLDLLVSVPDSAILAGMQYDVNNTQTAQDIKGILDAWKTGDAAKMENIGFKPKNSVPALKPYYDIIYDGYNLDLAKQIEGLLAGNKTHFIVVSANNLLGNSGLINLLKNKGYTIEQVNATK